MPPTRYLRLDWPEWGETDHLLTAALDYLDSMLCLCGCGQWKDEAYDPDTEHRWQVSVQKCYAGAAMAEFSREHGEELENTMMAVRLLPSGEEAKDPLVFDPERARAEYDALQERLGGVGGAG